MKKGYIHQLYDIWQPFGTTTSKPREVKYGCSHSWKYQTRYLSVFKNHGEAFYGPTGKGKKQVPKDLEFMLTAVGLAYWYMDDGGIKSKESKGVFLNTQGFTKLENENLCALS